MTLGAVVAPAHTAAALLAVAPGLLGGVRLKSAAGPRRDAWLVALRALLPADAPWLRLPLHIADERLLGGLDLAATLASGRPVAQRGVLAQADGGIVIAAMAERLSRGTAARLAQVLDLGAVQTARDGMRLNSPARIAVIALDEGIDEEALPTALADRLALHIDLDAPVLDDGPPRSAAEVAAARSRLPQVRCDDATLEALVAAAAAFGIASARAGWFALCAARAAAALAGRNSVNADDAREAVQWVLAPRATQLPESAAEADRAEPPPQDPSAEPEPPEPPAAPEPAADTAPAEGDRSAPDAALEDQLIDATRAAIPAGLLALLQGGGLRERRSASAGRAGALAASKQRGRPVGARRGEPCGGADRKSTRLNSSHSTLSRMPSSA